MSEDAMAAEFDTVAAWTAEAVTRLGPGHALPAACRGSGSPAALEWLVDRMGLAPGTTLLDVGAGVGGPAELAARHRGVVPTLVEPAEGACRAAARLFGRPVAVADGGALPFATDVFDAAWSLGVLCTVEDKERHLREMVRVVRPGGSIGLLVFVRTVERLPEQPEGNHFPTMAELHSLVQAVGLRAGDDAAVADFAASPEEWEQAASEVDAEIERDHGQDEGWILAQRQQQVMVDLITKDLVAGHLLVCSAPA